LRGFLISCNLPFVVVVNQLDKMIPLFIIARGCMVGLFLSNLKDKNFRSMIMLRPLFQKNSGFVGEAGVICIGDCGFVEEFGGPGVLKVLEGFFLIMHPLVAVAFMVMMRWF